MRRAWSFSRVQLYAALSLAVLLGLAGIVGGALVSGDMGPKHSDFVPYYAAAHLLTAGHGADLYSLTVVGRFERALVAPLHVADGVMPFLYPPFTALLLAPLGVLRYASAYFLWLAFNLVVLGGTLAALSWYTGLEGSRRALLITASISFVPTVVGLIQGQISLLILALLTGAFLALRAGHPVLCGVLLACALVKPPIVVPIVLVLLVRQEWKAVAGFLVAAASLLLVPFAIPGAPPLSGYVTMTREAAGWTTQIGGFQPRLSLSLPGQVETVIPGHVGTALALVLVVLTLAGVAYLTYRFSRLDVPFAAAVLAGILISPHLLMHDLTIALLPAAIAVRLSREFDGDPTAPLVFGYLSPLVGLPVSHLLPLQLTVVAALVLLAWLVRTGMSARPTCAPLGSPVAA